VIVGSVDSFKERQQLERFARRHLIPYVDIGMDVHKLGDRHYLIGGQVFLSSPGQPCLRCCNIVTDERLEQEALRYGDAGRGAYAKAVCACPPSSIGQPNSNRAL
jgi:hypothetical protein